MLVLAADHAIPNEAAFTEALLWRTTLRRRGSRHLWHCANAPRDGYGYLSRRPPGVDASLGLVEAESGSR